MSLHPPAGATQRAFGALPDGRAVHEITLSNGHGLVLVAITLGGIVTRLEAPDTARAPTSCGASTSWPTTSSATRSSA
jgi:galactose mutarotase-like enzyme